MIPTGRQIPLRHGDFAAVVTEVGAGLRELTWRGRPLVIGFAEDEIPDAYQGAVLAPWPNRIADGRYRFDGQLHQLDLSEPDAAQRVARTGQLGGLGRRTCAVRR